ncbi:hypothetical protein ACTG9Q_32845 [Actinokineospora sp. 24-640]
MKRRLGVGLAVVLVLAVAGVVVFGGEDEVPAGPRTVTGVVGSEKAPFFAERRVVDAFAAHGIVVRVDTAGSRQIATEVDLRTYDFAFPGSEPTAQRIVRDLGAKTSYSPFFSPMAVATFAPIADLLTARGVIRPGQEGRPVLDVARYLDLAGKGTRWDRLPGNTAFPARRTVLINTTDPRDSNSAAMYLAAMSYVANGNSVVNSPAEEAEVLPLMTRLFLDQGYTPPSSEGPFVDYLAAGMGKTPLALIYESQFLDRQIRGDGSIRDDMRLVYPAPTVLSKHTLVPVTPGGDEVGRLLTTDPGLQRLAAEFGFRTADPAHFRQVVADRKLDVPADLVDVVEPPSHESLERMLDAIGKQY